MALQSDEDRPCGSGSGICVNQDRYERITANVPSVVWEFELHPNGEMTYLFLSDNVERLFGVVAEEALADAVRLNRIIHRDDREAALAAMVRSAETLEPLLYQARWMTSDRQVRWYRSAGTPVRLDNGTVRWDGLLTDVTETVEADLARRATEERLRVALDAAEMGVWHWDLASGEVIRSPRAALLWPVAGGGLGGTLEEFAEAIHAEDRGPALKALERALKDGEPWQFEVRVGLQDGSHRWIFAKGNVNFDEQGRAVAMQGTMQDVSERKGAELQLVAAQQRAEAAHLELAAEVEVRCGAEARLRESEERYALAVQGANDGIWEWNLATDEVFFSSRLFELLGFGGLADLVTGREDVQELMHPEDQPRLIAELPAFIEGRDPLDVEVRLRIFDGTFRWFNLRGQAARSENGEINRMAGSLRDITERKQSEQLRDRFIEGVLHATDEERRRIARELHDGTGQALTSLLVSLRSVEQAVPEGEAKDRLDSLRELTARALDEVGRLARGLHPSVLDDLGFGAAVERFAAEYGDSYGLAVDVHMRGVDSAHRLPHPVETTLYRIVQEALTNIAKHAAAKTASVIVERVGGQVRAIIEDDGCGFDVEGVEQADAGSRGLGIHSIRERATLVLGSVAIESAPGQGTTLFVNIPVN